ncbi:MAG: citrate/2-methylcitrate synthase, partial [Candidatus Omnitrophica bacterium]|nr:citrate/2-methylcitrate synthase [Candidatus Omnitrophota bacterium]
MLHIRNNDTRAITDLILEAKRKAKEETQMEPEPELTKPLSWPVTCTVGPGLEGAIACETKIGYVNGSKGWLIYRGYDIFDLCAYSTFEEVSYLLLYGMLPNKQQLECFTNKLVQYRFVNSTIRRIMSYPVEEMNAMAALGLGTEMMRHEFASSDEELYKPEGGTIISSDEDSIPMETKPKGEQDAIYKFKKVKNVAAQSGDMSKDTEASLRLIAGTATMAAAVARLKEGKLPIEPDPSLSHAA